MLWNRLIGPAQQRFRTRRAERILARFPDIRGARIIDIGGSLAFWKIAGPILQPASVRMYNISAPRMEMGLKPLGEGIEAILYDGIRVPEPDGAADFVLCNSVIEHVPLGQRANFASEIRRLGRHYIVQTPSARFPLELHFGLPFVHWLPRPLGRALVRVSPFQLLTKSSATAFFDETRLLTRREFAGHFPGAEIEIEYAFGLPKSMLAFG